jgi:hypothetical protein
MSEQSRCTLAKASELARMSSERIRRSLELLGTRRRAVLRGSGEKASPARQMPPCARRSAPPPSGP